MSEEILKALIRLFAVISKQDGGVTEGERNYVMAFFRQQLGHDDIEQYITLYDTYTEYGKDAAKSTTTSLEDSVQTLRVSKKIYEEIAENPAYSFMFIFDCPKGQPITRRFAAGPRA